MEEKVIVVRKVIVVKNQRKRVETKEKVIQDQEVMMRKVEMKEKKKKKKKKKNRGSCGGEKGRCKGWQQGEAENPQGKKPTDETSTPFPGGPKNQTLLKSFNNHAAAIWNGEVTWDPYSSLRTDEDITEVAFYMGTIKIFGIVKPYHPTIFAAVGSRTKDPLFTIQSYSSAEREGSRKLCGEVRFPNRAVGEMARSCIVRTIKGTMGVSPIGCV
ncbi:hypothetical protein Scep_001495 [Stephania cephalantha]|uniref:Uncharacterized protein n=1 Tax=Stephania cephalantha TaxID=152367 RepID=A0AAP0LC41_9MAGN